MAAFFSSDCLRPGARPRELWGWALFDAANSGYSTVVLTAVFNSYFVSVICADADWATLAWTATLAAANLLCMAIMPGVARSADLRRRKKAWLVCATLACIAATALLCVTGPGTIALAAFLIIVSDLGYSVGESLNSAFLPALARPEAIGRVSGWGWSLGYGGGLVTLALCLLMVWAGDQLGCSRNALIAATGPLVAAVFLFVALPFFLWVREPDGAPEPVAAPRLGLLEGARDTLDLLRRYRDFAALALCGFLYQCGIATVIALAAVYAEAEMGFSVTQTLIMVLAVNVTAAVGAFGFGYLQDFLGHKLALALTLALWLGMVVTAVAARGETLFWVSANLAGLAMGSSQSAGRALVGVFAPASCQARFYGLWNMALWLAAAVGPLTYGTLTWLSAGNHRLALAATGAFFAAAALVLLFIRVGRGAALARERDACPAPSGETGHHA